ncbi:hypothetical protein KPH14_003343 [Odynerus spinipes]|nr:hypothetical protein KPH14_003343 [Odynerus spinipes]
MEMVKEKPRRRSVSELLDWRCIPGLKGGGCGGGASGANSDAGEADGIYFEDYDKSPETRRRKRSGTWPRTRSLNAPSPIQQFGPCGRIMKNSAMVM